MFTALNQSTPTRLIGIALHYFRSVLLMAIIDSYCVIIDDLQDGMQAYRERRWQVMTGVR
ncbi:MULTISPECIES: hypothetical protein [unclassified Psychrobacter]|uniref:hypothetical protein n=1 Tax=unclassified Psychrobacter TaxID=196806 RepID=UPI001623E3DB|nr:hypothetical protein [Psychrobacter sp. MES7-P7E]